MFGLGEKTGIELYEYSGVVAGRDYTENVLNQPWYDGSTLAAAIGQENNQFTPLQLANYIATLVNGGNHYSAHLLKEVKSADYSEVLYTREPELLDTIEIEPENLDAVLGGMLLATSEGTASAAFADFPFKTGGKTGSAQVSRGSSNGIYVGYAPYDNPQIAVAVVIEHGGSGGNASHVARDVFWQYFFGAEGTIEATQKNVLLP